MHWSRRSCKSGWEKHVLIVVVDKITLTMTKIVIIIIIITMPIKWQRPVRKPEPPTSIVRAGGLPETGRYETNK